MSSRVEATEDKNNSGTSNWASRATGKVVTLIYLVTLRRVTRNRTKPVFGPVPLRPPTRNQVFRVTTDRVVGGKRNRSLVSRVLGIGPLREQRQIQHPTYNFTFLSFNELFLPRYGNLIVSTRNRFLNLCFSFIKLLAAKQRNNTKIIREKYYDKFVFV